MNELTEILQNFHLNVGWLITLLIIFVTTFVEISKIKINPWTALFKSIGKLINGDLISKIDSLSEKVDALSTDFETHTVESQRSEILDFANSCMNGRKHTKEEFDHIIKVHDSYAIYVKQHMLENGQITIAYEYIEKIYKKCIEENGFL